MHFVLTTLTILYALLCLSSSVSADEEETWSGKWFPNKPGNPDTNPHTSETETKKIVMGISNDECDNGKDNLGIDFNPKNELVYMCLDNKTNYKPNYKTQPIIKEFRIPKTYSAIHNCMNESIEYEERIPTFGTHRPLWPKYGEYLYVPVQRWIHNLEHGAIVVLYHPCSNSNQVEKLRSLVKGCLYRYVITSSERLSSERPFALVAWGTSIEFSVVDSTVVVEFIKKNALNGPEKVSRDGQYDELLAQKAEIVSTIDDDVLCPTKS